MREPGGAHDLVETKSVLLEPGIEYIRSNLNRSTGSDLHLPQISMKKLMSLQNRGRFAGFKKGGKYRRRPKRNDIKNVGKKAAYGVLGGMAVSIPLTLLGRHYQRPELIEAGQRVGAIVASKVGGPIGETGFQLADAAFDRVVVYQGGGVSGSQGQVYL